MFQVAAVVLSFFCLVLATSNRSGEKVRVISISCSLALHTSRYACAVRRLLLVLHFHLFKADPFFAVLEPQFGEGDRCLLIGCNVHLMLLHWGSLVFFLRDAGEVRGSLSRSCQADADTDSVG